MTSVGPVNLDCGALPDFQVLVQAIDTYKESNELDEDQTQTMMEIERRISQISCSFPELMDLNNELISRKAPKVIFDENSSILQIRTESQTTNIKLNSADSNKKPRLVKSAFIGAYVAETGRFASKTTDSIKLNLERKLENFYQNAHRAIVMCKKLPNIDKVGCKEISMARNKLIEHPRTGEKYSFGYSTNGPMIRPIKYRGSKEWIDQGLLPNTREFVKSLAGAFLDIIK